MVKKQLFTQINVNYLVASSIVLNINNYPNFVKWCVKTKLKSFAKPYNLHSSFSTFCAKNINKTNLSALDSCKNFCEILSNQTLQQQYIIYKQNSGDDESCNIMLFNANLTAQLTFGYLLFNYEYLSNITFTASKAEAIITVTSTDGPFKTMKNIWKIANINETSCDIDFDIEFSLKNQLLEIPAKLHINQISQTILNCFTNQALLHKTTDNKIDI